MSITVLSQTTPSGSQFPEDLAGIIEEEPGKSETEARSLVQGLNDAKINWQAEAGKTWTSPNASITRRRNEIATGEKKYLRAAYLAAPEIRISE